MADSFIQVIDWIFSSLLSMSQLMVANQLLQMSLSVGLLLLVWKIYKLLL